MTDNGSLMESDRTMRATHRDGRLAYAQPGERYEAVFGDGTTLQDILLLELRNLTGDWRVCYDGRRYVESDAR